MIGMLAHPRQQLFIHPLHDNHIVLVVPFHACPGRRVSIHALHPQLVPLMLGLLPYLQGLCYIVEAITGKLELLAGNSQEIHLPEGGWLAQPVYQELLIEGGDVKLSTIVVDDGIRLAEEAMDTLEHGLMATTVLTIK